MTSKNKSPAFQAYPADWLSSPRVAMMTPAQEGAYWRLCLYCWASGDVSLPDDDHQLAALSRLGEGWLNGGGALVKKCFIPHPTKPGYLSHKRLLFEAEKQSNWREKSSEGGRKSAENKRKSKGCSTTQEPKADSSSSLSSSSSKRESNKELLSLSATEADMYFQRIWEVYPYRRKGGGLDKGARGSRKKAFEKYYKLLKKEKDCEQFTCDVIQGCFLYTAYLDRNPGHPSQHLITWLNGNGWEDDYTIAEDKWSGGGSHGDATAEGFRGALRDLGDKD